MINRMMMRIRVPMPMAMEVSDSFEVVRSLLLGDELPCP
jgi:hypothetical protein